MSDDLFKQLVRGEMSLSTYENGGKPRTFEVGARVRAKVHVGHNNIENATGTIRTIVDTYETVVEFDEPVQGHNGHGDITSERGWFIDTELLELI